MRERLTFHFELRTRSGNFRFFFSSFLLSFCFSNQGKISSCNTMGVVKGIKVWGMRLEFKGNGQDCVAV